MAQKLSKGKRGGKKPRGIRIKPKEGLWIKYQLALRDLTIEAFARQNGVRGMAVSSVLKGRSASARLRMAMVRTLGYPSFEAMIAEARGKGGSA
jgi:hypothetical protein